MQIFEFNLPYIIEEIINEIDFLSDENADVCGIINIFEDETTYWILNTDGSWQTLSKIEPQEWVVEELISAYLSILYSKNDFTDEVWYGIEHEFDAEKVTVTLKIDTDEEVYI